MIVYAYANHGRWVADCPRCNGAELVQFPQSEFVCSGSLVPEVRKMGQPTPPRMLCGFRGALQWPVERVEIERALDLRPMAENMNWRHPETVADLWRENGQRGIG